MNSGSKTVNVLGEVEALPTLRVLLIEDNEDDAILARRDLARSRRCYFSVEWEPTLAAGTDRLTRGGIDVVLLDLSLPDCTGIETFERLWTRFRNVPTIVLTGHDDEDTAVQTVRLGAQDYLVKGQMQGDSLARAIAYAIERQHATRQVAVLAQELSVRNTLLQEELELAHEIQRALLPGPTTGAEPAPGVPEERPWLLAHRYLPTASLAGDFFKVYPLSEGRVGLLICDVMGHGVRSALIAALLCGLIEEFEFEREAPGMMLNRLNSGLNRVLGQCRADMFATACYVVVDPRHGQVTVANAGHPMPYLLQRANAEVVALDQCRGPALGLFETSDYSETVTQISNDDLIVLYTDGISEVEQSSGGFFETHLPEALRRRIGQEIEGLLDSLLDEARQFSGTGGFHDDVCLIALQVGRTEVRTANHTEEKV